MFFFLSKALSFLISPLFWIIAAFVTAFVLKKSSLKRNFYVICLAMLVFFSNSFIVDEFIRLWEVPLSVETLNSVEYYDAGIVLGGGMITKDAETGIITFRNNVDRILQGVELYRSGKIRKIIISSGSGSLIYRNMKESTLLKDYLVNSLNIPEVDVLVDSTSDNTYQNAVNTSILLKEHPEIGNLLLITSSVHMRRALACFKKQGVETDIYPTNKITGKRQWNVWHLIVPDIYALFKWNILIHEVTGYLMYLLIGYI